MSWVSLPLRDPHWTPSIPFVLVLPRSIDDSAALVDVDGEGWRSYVCDDSSSEFGGGDAFWDDRRIWDGDRWVGRGREGPPAVSPARRENDDGPGEATVGISIGEGGAESRVVMGAMGEDAGKGQAKLVRVGERAEGGQW